MTKRSIYFLAILGALHTATLFGQTSTILKNQGTAKLQKGKKFGVSNLLVIRSSAVGRTSELSPKNYKTLAGNLHRYEDAKANFGLGLGLDYGGVGARLTLLPDPHFGLIFGGGYAIAGAGFNGGVIFRINPEKKYVTTFSGMYGYNAAIQINGLPPYSQYASFNKLYYGPSLAIGLMSRSERHKKKYWHFEIIVPFRSDEYKNNVDLLQKNSNISITTLPPFALFGIGFHF